MVALISVIPAFQGVDFLGFSEFYIKKVIISRNKYKIYNRISVSEEIHKNGEQMGNNKKVPEVEQPHFSFLDKMEEQSGRPGKGCIQAPPNFHDPDPERIFVGEVSLRKYLESNGFSWVIRLRELIGQSDWRPFMRVYTGRGRKAVHPRILLGLICYGMFQRQWSLRDLEKLAVRDVGAWWICGGVQADHSTIGRFINTHAEVLSEPYFISMVQQLVCVLKINAGEVAGDGTVTEAYGSRFKSLKAEALREKARQARQEALENPTNEAASIKAEQAAQAVQAADERRQQAKTKGRKADNVKVCLTEPEAMVQPLKNNARRPSYKPSVLANKTGLIVGQSLDPSNEAAMIKPMLKQHEQIFGVLPSGLFLDGGYNSFGVLSMAVEMDLDILVPANRQQDNTSGQSSSTKQGFLKRDFRYDETADIYICPAGKHLHKTRGVQVHQGRKLQKYQCKHPEQCSYKQQCTKSKQGRTIIRFEDDELKEAMRKVLEHPLAKARSRQRKWMVEPVFSALKDRQGLTKFHRRGLKKVKVEFALHCIAYNLGRAIRLERRVNATFLQLFCYQEGDKYVVAALLWLF